MAADAASGDDMAIFRTPVRGIAGIALIALFIPGCGLLGPNEEYRQDSGRTVYRSADHSGQEEPLPLSKRKVPGE